MADLSRRTLLKQAGVCLSAAMVLGLDAPTAHAAADVVAPQGAELAPWAAQRFIKHKNCCQAVLEAFASRYRLDMATAQKISSAFAGGMCQGELCGSCTGAFLVIGLAHGATGAPSRAVTGRVADFSKAMKKQYGSLSCSALLGTDMATAEGVTLAARKGLFDSFCPKVVEAAVNTLQAIL